MTVSATPSLSSPAAVSRRGLLRAGVAGGLTLTMGATGLLAGCGSGDIVSALAPSRFISFGDGLSDLGQGGSRYTINDGSLNIWVERLANRYGKTITAQSAGGLGYAQGHAVGDALPRSIAQQIDAFLAAHTLGSSDVVLINLPMADVLAPMAAVKAGTLSEASANLQIEAAARVHVAQVRRLLAAGAKYIVVAGVYDMGKSPWAISQNRVSAFTNASLRLNDAFKVEAVTLGSNVLFVDAAFLVNRNSLQETRGTYGFFWVEAPICTTPTALGCTSGTLVAGTTASQYLFADAIHMTPAGNYQLGDYAYDQLNSRW